MEKNVKDIIAYLKRKDPDGMECFEYEPDDANKIVKYYYYERLNWCGCGLPETAVDTVAKFLEAMAERDVDNRHMKLKEYFKVRYIEDDPMLLCLAYTMDGAELTEHGSSIGWAWLTEDGENFLWAIREAQKLGILFNRESIPITRKDDAD